MWCLKLSSYSSQFIQIANDVDRMLALMFNLRDENINRALNIAQGQILLAKKLFQAKIISSKEYLELVVSERMNGIEDPDGMIHHVNKTLKRFEKTP